METEGLSGGLYDNEQMKLLEQDFSSEFEHMKEEMDELEDEIERYYQEKAGEDHEGSIREPSLILCWFIVGVVTVYVIFLGFQGTVPSIIKDEL